MKKYMIHLDSHRCVACHGCEIHCKVHKNLPVGTFLCAIKTTPLVRVGGIPRTEITFSHCHHCEDPPCVPACPKNAMIKRDDGIVFIDQEKCIGCLICTRVCPWNIPVINPETRKAIKCDLCKDRLDEGLEPACVAKCATHALKLMLIKPA